MLYTLAKFFIWGLGFAVIGAIVGWLLRSIRCRSEVEEARRTTVDLDEVQRLRHRVANLEPMIAERDTLRARIADLELEAKSAPLVPAGVAAFAAVGSDGGEAASAVDGGVTTAVAPVATFAGFGLSHDADAAKAALGSNVAADDLKVVEGIGPVLEQVLHNGGITTWAELGAADPDHLRSILVGADERHRMHNPTSWPRQARLAAIGEWDALKAFQDQLTAGRH